VQKLPSRNEEFGFHSQASVVPDLGPVLENPIKISNIVQICIWYFRFW